MSSDHCMMGNQNIHENPSNSIHTKQLRLFVGTWNVGGRAPTRETRESMHEWLLGSPPPDEPADIYVIGFQEIVPLNAGNILGIHLKNGNDAGLSASDKWDALICATLNSTNSTSIRRTTSDSTFANSVATPNLVRTASAAIFDENAANENHCVTPLYDRHRGDIHAESHPCDGGHLISSGSANTQSRYDGDDGIGLHYMHVNGSNTKTPNLCECNKFHDQDGNDDNDNRGHNSSLNHAKTGKQDDHNHQNIPYMGQCAYATVPHTSPFTEQKSAAPSSSIDRAGVIYLTPPSARDTVPFDDMEPDLDFSTIADRSMYIGVARKHMVGLFISVWVRRHLRRHVKAVQVSSVGCGIMNRLGNKGSVSVSLSVHDTRFCFICTHLRSGDKPGDVSRRNSDINSILQRTRFHCPERPHSKIANLLPKTILAHDRIIWLGDLNYRLTLSTNELHNFLIQEDWKALIETDELGRERTIGGVFEGWHEGTICFAPTYKYRINSNTYAMVNAKDGSKRHNPAWCDRILWHGKGLKQLSYTRCESRHSDHRPVRSFFMVEVESLENPSRLTTHHLASQSIEPFLVDIKEVLSTTNLSVNHVVLSNYTSHT